MSRPRGVRRRTGGRHSRPRSRTRLQGSPKPGDPLWLEGRLQSRIYRKILGEEIQERTAFEVSISALEEPTEEAEAPSADEETNMVF